MVILLRYHQNVLDCHVIGLIISLWTILAQRFNTHCRTHTRWLSYRLHQQAPPFFDNPYRWGNVEISRGRTYTFKHFAKCGLAPLDHHTRGVYLTFQSLSHIDIAITTRFYIDGWTCHRPTPTLSGSVSVNTYRFTLRAVVVVLLPKGRLTFATHLKLSSFCYGVLPLSTRVATAFQVRLIATAFQVRNPYLQFNYNIFNLVCQVFFQNFWKNFYQVSSSYLTEKQ